MLLLRLDMEEENSHISNDLKNDENLRLSQIKLDYKFSEINEKLNYFDEIRKEMLFQKTLIRINGVLKS